METFYLMYFCLFLKIITILFKDRKQLMLYSLTSSQLNTALVIHTKTFVIV